MPSKRSVKGAAAGAALLLASFACSDRSTAPTAVAGTPSSLMAVPGSSMAKAQPGHAGPLPTQGDTVRFTVDPARGGEFRLASGHVIVFPDHAICDPATSTYGVEHWDEPCDLATKPIQITAVSMVNADGLPYVTFQPSMRFAPAKAQRDWVMLYLHGDRLAKNVKYQIDWCYDDGACVDESATDSRLHTRKLPYRATIYRRIKHFTGYNVAARSSSTLSTDY